MSKLSSRKKGFVIAAKNIDNYEVDNVTLICNVWFLITISLTVSHKSKKIMCFIKKSWKNVIFWKKIFLVFTFYMCVFTISNFVDSFFNICVHVSIWLLKSYTAQKQTVLLFVHKKVFNVFKLFNVLNILC